MNLALKVLQYVTRTQYVANSGHDFIYFLVEDKNTEYKGTIRKDDNGDYFKYITAHGAEDNCKIPFTKLAKGQAEKFEGEKGGLMVITGRGETLCANYRVPNRRSIIVLEEGLETAKEGYIWIGENGKNYQVMVPAAPPKTKRIKRGEEQDPMSEVSTSSMESSSTDCRKTGGRKDPGTSETPGKNQAKGDEHGWQCPDKQKPSEH